MPVVFPPTHSRFNKSVREFDYSCFDNSELVQGEANPSKVGVPHGVTSTCWLRKIITRYHISPNFVYEVLNFDEYISTPGPLEVVFYEKAFRVGLRIFLHPFIALFLWRYDFVPSHIHPNS